MNNSLEKKSVQSWLNKSFDESSIQLLFEDKNSEDQIGDEIVCGFATINHKAVAFWANRPEQISGTISKNGFIKINQLIDIALDKKIPVIAFLSSTGISINESTLAGEAFSKVLMKMGMSSGIIPFYGMIMGINIGASSYLAAMMDFVLFNRVRSHICISPPHIVKSVLGENSSYESLGGSKLHEFSTGFAHFVDDSIAQQIDRLKKLIQFFPSSRLELAQSSVEKTPEKKLIEVPERAGAPFDMKDFLLGIIDQSSLLEYCENYAKSALTAWCYIGGFPVAIIANQCLYDYGVLNADSSKKLTRFIKISDSMNIPIITFIDCPGFLPGEKEEAKGALLEGAELVKAMNTNVAKFSVIVRKCYGAAAIILGQSKSFKGELVLALKNARCAPMGFSAAREILYSNSALSVKELEDNFYTDLEDPKIALQQGIIDEIIEAEQIRAKLIKSLKESRLRSESK